MKSVYVLLVLLYAVAGILASEEILDIPDDILDEFNYEDLNILREIEQKKTNADMARENDLASKIAADVYAESSNAQSGAVQIDPCSQIHCSAGKICKADGNSASCICIPECPTEQNPRLKVCTSKNETWNSDCEVYRQRCLCNTNHSDCLGADFEHIHIDYYGSCKELRECTEEEMSDFPRRMRDWLFNIMRDLAERNELPEHYISMQAEAETNLTRGWANAAVWKWCDLDEHPHDRSVSRHELFPIRAPLVSLEHCIAPFLESCDPNGDHRITLKEWGNCLGLDEGDMLEQCDGITKEKAYIAEESITV